MKILHLVHSEDPPFLLRLQGRDASLLQDRHAVERWTLGSGRIVTPEGEYPERKLAAAVLGSNAQTCHFYTGHLPDGQAFRALRVPWIASTSSSSGWLFWKRSVEPTRRISPHPAFGGPNALPEAVDPGYFEIERDGERRPVVAGIVNDQTRTQYEAVRSRIARFREDVVWRTFQQVPSPEELSEVTSWVDFGTDHEKDESGIPEAIVAGCATIAPRTDLNRKRLLEGDAGFLVPKKDPNEMAHVILTALFKPEVASKRSETALANRDRFSPINRIRELNSIYESLAPR